MFWKRILSMLTVRRPISKMFVCIALFVCFLLATDLHNTIFGERWTLKPDLKAEKVLYDELFSKAELVGLARFEITEFYNEFIVAANDIIGNAKNSVTV